jgi:hypothetical protein
VLLAASAAVTGCKETESGKPQVGSNSNWLTACDVPADCSADNIPECACGVCTVQCAADEDCSAIANARCALEASAAARSSCIAQDMSLGICLPRCEPGGCYPEQACVNGACVLAALPDNAFCNALPPSDEQERRLADELLALAQARRTAGDLSCGDTAAQPQLELRLSPELMCAARALAVDMERTRALSVMDSQGRGTGDRLQLAGYPAMQWGEAYALEATSAERALSLMLQEQFNCESLGSATFVDVGIAVSGDAYVMTLSTF